jgi:lipid II:glycine glycyltransferase (peptidoglycan interpeptide bridge formation enzyme)
MNFCEVKEKEFKDFSLKSKASSFLQSIEMYERYKKDGIEAYLVGVRDDKKLVAASLVVMKRQVKGRKIFVAPRGFMTDFEALNFSEVLETFTAGAKKFFKSKGGMILEISPNIIEAAQVDNDGVPTGSQRKSKMTRLFEKNGYKNLGEFEFVKWEYSLDLTKLKADELLKWIRSGHRYATRLALERYMIRVRELNISELQTLKDLSEEAAERHGFITPKISYYKEMKEAFGDKVKFYVAEVKESVVLANERGEEIAKIKEIAAKRPVKNEKYIPVAAAMFVFYGDEVIYLYSGSSTKYAKYGGAHLMQYEMIRKAILEGYKKYNFYGTNPVKGDGVYEFKRGYHGELMEYIGTFILPLDILGKAFSMKQKYQEIRDLH